MQKPMIIKTIVHLTDDKGWKKDESFEGEQIFGNIYRVRKFPKDTISLISENLDVCPHPKDLDYEFKLEKDVLEKFSLNYFIKHLFYTMR